MKFIDLFAGLGGFHLALESLGHKCVLASEIDEELQKLYKKNFKGTKVVGDITKIKARDIPDHDILCAGFPCQSYSKAGKRRGRNDEKNGNLADEIIRILKSHQPKYFILENVPNFLSIDGGETWRDFKAELENKNYGVFKKILSPHQFNVPQVRKRVFIVGIRNDCDSSDLWEYSWPHTSKDCITLKEFVRNNISYQEQKSLEISKDHKKYISVWQQLLNKLDGSELPSTLWAMEFGATYPINHDLLNSREYSKINDWLGSFGAPLNGLTKEDANKLIPKYTSKEGVNLPKWKQIIIDKNRTFYKNNKKVIDEWMPKIKGFKSSFQKLEWQSDKSRLKIFDNLIQFRPSGIRIKDPKFASTLVAINHTQIIGWEKRYLSVKDAQKLQSMDELTYLPEVTNKGYKAFGNAVNVEVIRNIAHKLLDRNFETLVAYEKESLAESILN